MGTERRDTRSTAPCLPVTLVGLGLVLAAGCLQAASPARLAGSGAGKWSYGGEQGPDHWAELSADFRLCQAGQAQSPINLAGARPTLEEPLLFRYRSNPLTLVNDGHTLRIDYEPGSHIRVGPRRYELLQTQFHTPGEHRVNGFAAEMVAQFIHRDLEGNLAIVEVPFVSGRRTNNVLARIWEHLPEQPGSSFHGQQIGINPTFMLPNERIYFSYHGSLTTPPCTEGVEWFVFRQPVEVDGALIRRLERLFGTNARPIQPLNGRPISLQSR